VKIIKEISAMQDIADFHRRTGNKIGLIPTMGFLHEGHVSLMIKAKDECDIIITSIFVNPTQFNPDEDFSEYPRDFMRDYHICKSSGVNYIFYPETINMFSDDYHTYINVEDLSEKLEGKFRPGHFRGVVTVVSKLFNICKPHKAYFGQKDAQQAVIIKKMSEDLNIDVEIEICPTVREENGLAVSSRNTYLSGKEKSEATALNGALNEGKELILEKHLYDAKEVKEKIKEYIEKKSPNTSIQYIAITDNKNLVKLENLADYNGEILISLAAFHGKTRLIDNILFIK